MTTKQTHVQNLVHIDEEKTVLHALKDKKSEKDAFTLISRCQLTCGNGKTDTYFAKVDKTTVFVKGPYKQSDSLRIMIERNEAKKKLGFEVGWMFMIELESDMWESVPLGIRRNMNVGDKAWFVVCKDLIGVSQKLHTKEKTSKLWPVTQVVDFDKYEVNEICDRDLACKEIGMQYVLLLLYRDIFGITDHASRNFIVDRKKRIVYSVDEDCAEADAKLNKMPAGRRKLIRTFLNENKKDVETRLHSWSQSSEKCKVWLSNKSFEDIVALFE